MLLLLHYLMWWHFGKHSAQFFSLHHSKYLISCIFYVFSFISPVDLLVHFLFLIPSLLFSANPLKNKFGKKNSQNVCSFTPPIYVQRTLLSWIHAVLGTCDVHLTRVNVLWKFFSFDLWLHSQPHFDSKRIMTMMGKKDRKCNHKTARFATHCNATKRH